MSENIIVSVLLAAGVLVQLVCCIGLLGMRNQFDRLHAVAPGNIVPPVLFAAAIVIKEGVSQSGVKAILIALAIICTAPIVSHATARAAWLRHKRALCGEK